MKVRWKLIVVVLVPLLALAAIVGLEVAERRSDAQKTEQARELIQLMGAADQLRGDVQLPVTLVVLPKGHHPQSHLRAAHGDAANSIVAFESALSRIDPASYGPEFVGAVTNVQDALQDYKAATPDARTTHEVSDIVTTVLKDLVFAAAKSISHDGELARGALGYASLVAANEGLEHAVHHIAHVGSGPAPEDRIRGTVAEKRQEDLALEVFRTTASTAQRDQLEQLLADPKMKQVEAAIASVGETQTGKPFGFDFSQLVAPMERAIEVHNSYADQFRADLEAQAASKQDSAEKSVVFFLLVALAAAVVALALAIVVVINLSRRLRRLVTGARTLADEQLPAMVESLRNPGASETLIGEPVVLEKLGRDEIGELGQAFNSVQRTFVEVARDQAELLRKGISEIYVKLARRNQSLVERQIELLDTLEAEEKDPDILANLFRLDHLATRIRRNAESLLVLAGVDPTRKWSEPVALNELVQGAMAEIEDYERIKIAPAGRAETIAMVVGPASLDLAHLFAELLDNAVRFSPPDTTVDVITRRRSDSYTVYISDSGVGMTDEQLEQANELLVKPPEPGLDLSLTLGLYVVARLASRHGVAVRLARSPFDGVVASVALPPNLVVEAPAPEETPVVEAAAVVPTTPVVAVAPVVAGVELPVREPAGGALEPASGTTLPVAAPQNDGPSSPHVEEALAQRAQAPEAPETQPATPTNEPQSSNRALGVAVSSRTPEERRDQLTRFLEGVDEGRRLGHPEPDSPREQAS